MKHIFNILFYIYVVGVYGCKNPNQNQNNFIDL